MKTFGLALWEKLKSANVEDFIRLKSLPLSSLGLDDETIDSGVAGIRQTSILATMSEDAYVRDLPKSATPEGLVSIPTGMGLSVSEPTQTMWRRQLRPLSPATLLVAVARRHGAPEKSFENGRARRSGRPWKVMKSDGRNAGRLLKVKRHYDHDNVFSAAIPLPVNDVGRQKWKHGRVALN